MDQITTDKERRELRDKIAIAIMQNMFRSNTGNLETPEIITRQAVKVANKALLALESAPVPNHVSASTD